MDSSRRSTGSAPRPPGAPSSSSPPLPVMPPPPPPLHSRNASASQPSSSSQPPPPAVLRPSPPPAALVISSGAVTEGGEDEAGRSATSSSSPSCQSGLNVSVNTKSSSCRGSSPSASSSSLLNGREKKKGRSGEEKEEEQEGRGGRPGCLSWLKSLLPRSDLPGARQKTPLGLNRYVVLAFYVFIGFTTSAVFYGWTALSAMMFKTEAFSYLCLRDPVTGLFAPDLRVEEGKLYICDEQDVAVQKLYTVTFAVCCTMSACAGTLLDWLGPLYTGVLGQCFNLLGWLLFAFSSAEYSAYYAALIFIGLGADTGFLPTLCIRRLFPGSSGLIITILGSAASASFGIPLILNELVNRYHLTVRTVSLIYCGFGPVLAMGIEILLMPRKGFALDDEGKIYKDTDREPDLLPSQGKTSQDGGHVLQDQPAKKEDAPHQTPHSLPASDPPAAPSSSSSSSSSSPNPPSPPPAVSSASSSREVSLKRRLQVFFKKLRTSSFWRQFFSLRYFLIALYFVVVSWSSAYYQQAARRMLSPEVVTVMEILLPLSFVPCIILGKLADMIGIIKVLVIVNTFGVLMYAFSFPKMLDPTGYISVVSFVMYMSLFTSQVFVYIEATFSPDHFGKLIGVASMIGGLSSLVTNALYEDVTVKKNDGDPLVIQIVMTVLLFMQYLWVLVLGILRRRNPTPYTKKAAAASCSGLKKVVLLQGGAGGDEEGEGCEEELKKKKGGRKRQGSGGGKMLDGAEVSGGGEPGLHHNLSAQLTSPSSPSLEQGA